MYTSSTTDYRQDNHDQIIDTKVALKNLNHESSPDFLAMRSVLATPGSFGRELSLESNRESSL